MAGDEGIAVGYEYELDIDPPKEDAGPPGRVVVLRELTAVEFEGLAKSITSDTVNPGWELIQRGLRLSLVKDRGEPLTYQKLAGNLLANRFRTKQLTMLRTAWEQIHSPDAGESAAIKNMRAVGG